MSIVRLSTEKNHWSTVKVRWTNFQRINKSVNVSLYQKTTIKFSNKKDNNKPQKYLIMKLQNLFIAAAVLFATTAINAQAADTDTNEGTHTVTIGIDKVALLDIEGGNIDLSATAPTEAGNKVEFNHTDNTTWINYSSIVGTDATRAVAVQITGDVPAGLDLSVQAAAYSGNGEGATGSVVATPIVLDTNSQTIITAIGSAYTGDETGNGHQLTYSLTQSEATDSYAALSSVDAQVITITYTLSDD